MAYIYQITNKINNKIYVGKTEFSIEKRFKKHCADAFRDRNEKRPLYAAMRKYGVENFEISLIEETDQPDEREIYWIEQKKSFKNGYNATMGGDGRKYIDYDDVIKQYLILKNQTEVSKMLKIHVDTVHKILIENNIPISIRPQKGNQIFAFDLQNNFIDEFSTQCLAAQWIIKQNKTTSTDIKKIASNIGRAVDQKKRKTAYGYVWKSIK